jgi:hypothetical protein
MKIGGMNHNAPVVSIRDFKDLREELDRARDGRRIFLGSMGDLGGEWSYMNIDNPDYEPGMPAEFRYRLNARRVMSAAEVKSYAWDLINNSKRHQFIILTKSHTGMSTIIWPQNTTVGMSVTSQRMADIAIDSLQFIKAGKRCLSIEPLLEHVDMLIATRKVMPKKILDWVIVGALSRPGHKPLVDTAKSIVTFCAAESIPCFVKENMRRADKDFDWPMQIPGE